MKLINKLFKKVKDNKKVRIVFFLLLILIIFSMSFMFANDLLLSFAFMAILFLRQIFILRQPNKINYAPLMVGIGLISSIVHFIIHPEVTDFVLLVRESLFPLLVSLLLYIVMNI